MNPTYVPIKKTLFFFQLNSKKKCGNTLELLNEHKKKMLAKGNSDFIFLEMGKIFGIRKINYVYIFFT
jgi:hypothetical protein